MSPPLVSIAGVSKVFEAGGQRIRAVDNVELTIGRGEFVALMGPSGSGKTSLLNILGCLGRPSCGRYLFDGVDVFGLTVPELAAIRGRRIGFVFQSHNLLPRATARENVALPMQYHRVSATRGRNDAESILRGLGLGNRGGHFPNQLSGGEQQRVAIARALAVGPDLILADEPTGSLDSKTGMEIMMLFRALNEQGLTIVVVTHDEAVARHARRIIRMQDGAIVDDDRANRPLPTPVEIGNSDRSGVGAKPTSEGWGSTAKLVTSIRMALRSLRAHRLRSGLTTLGIVIGIAAVITMVAVADGVQHQVTERMRSLGANLLLVRPGQQTSQGVRLEAGSRVNLSEDDAGAVERDVPEVIVAAPFRSGRGQVVSGNRNWSTTIAGITPDYLIAREWIVDDGENLSSDHLENAGKVVLLGQTVANALFGPNRPIGQRIRIGKTPFTVIGLLRTKGQDASGRDQDDVVMMPLSTAKIRVLGRGLTKPRSVNAILVKNASDTVMDKVESEIRLLLRQRHRILPDQEDDFTIQRLTELSRTQQDAFRQFTLLVATLASVSLVVGGIGVMNIMLVSVAERTRENGLRLALGARPRDLGSQYLTEAVTLSMIGGAVGVGVGMAAAGGITYLVGWSTFFRPGAIVVALIFSAIVGVLFGTYPAIKASRTDPIDALRVE